MNNETRIIVENASKKFSYDLQTSIKYGFRDAIAQTIGRYNPSGLRKGEFWAVNNVSFEVNSGESFAIMGVNGSGKTTLLRMLIGIYKTDQGCITTYGQIGSLLSAGAGFAPMLTGRENIYVNASILGLSKAEIDKKFDEIVDFSGLEEFLDMPIKNYSSGMSVKLGFSIAALSRPEILIIDEALAVGDMHFQKKCYEYILSLKREGTSVILVSHSVGAVWSVCDKGLVLHRGETKFLGHIEGVIRAYDRYNNFLSEQELKEDSRNITVCSDESMINKVSVLDAQTHQEKTEFHFHEDFIVEFDISIYQPVEDPDFRITFDAMHYRFISVLDNVELGSPIKALMPGNYKVRFIVKTPPLRPGVYKLNASIVKRSVGIHLVNWLSASHLQILPPENIIFYSEPNAVFQMDCKFEIEKLK